MKFKSKLILLCAILGALVIGYILGTLFTHGSRSQIKEVALFPGLKSEQVASISLASPEAAVTLSKDGAGAWTVQAGDAAFPADGSKIDTLITSVSGLKQLRVVSRNMDNAESFDLTESTASVIRFADEDGRQLADLSIGKDSGGGNYVSLARSDVIVTTDRSLSFYTSQSRDYWTNLKLFPQDMQGAGIDSITVKAEGAALSEDAPPVTADYTLFKAAEGGVDVWKVSGMESFSLDLFKVDYMANSLAALRVRSFAGLKADLAAYSPAPDAPLAEIRFTTGAGAVYVLMIFESGNPDEKFLTLDSSPYLYSAAVWTLQTVLKGTEELKKAE